MVTLVFRMHHLSIVVALSVGRGRSDDRPMRHPPAEGTQPMARNQSKAASVMVVTGTFQSRPANKERKINDSLCQLFLPSPTRIGAN